jgi:hypothetical protein
MTRSVSSGSEARRQVARLWSATANPEGPGLLERGREFQPTRREEFDPRVVEAVVRLARLAASLGEVLGDCPDARVRRSAAILAARAYPVRAALDAS